MRSTSLTSNDPYKLPDRKLIARFEIDGKLERPTAATLAHEKRIAPRELFLFGLKRRTE